MKTSKKKKTLKDLSAEVTDLKFLFNDILRYFDTYITWKGDRKDFRKHVEGTHEQ